MSTGKMENLVFDVGHDGFVAGWAGTDSPLTVLPPVAGIIRQTPPSNPQYFIGKESLQSFQPGLEIQDLLHDGMIQDWDAFERMLEYIYTDSKSIRSDSKIHPVLMSEAPWNEKNKREKTVEILFEKFNIPAFYLAKSPVLSCFGFGRQTGLIVDNDRFQTSIIPVLDSKILPQGIVRIPMGSDKIDQKCRQLLPNFDEFIIQSSANATESYRKYKFHELMDDFHRSSLERWIRFGLDGCLPADVDIVGGLPRCRLVNCPTAKMPLT